MSLGFKKAPLEYAATKGLMNHIPRIRPGGPRVFSAQQVLELAELLNVQVPENELQKLKQIG